MKIAIIGAGSASFGRGVLADLFQPQVQQIPDLQICLVDTNPDALARMTALAAKFSAHTGSAATVTATTDRREALPGADYIVTAVTIQRMALWEQDYRVPMAHGVHHILGENGGPGALFHAMRNLDLMIPICRDAEELCPNALLLNFTNPEARILHAILHLTKVQALGLCHGVFSLENLASQVCGVPLEHLEVTSAGMNHAYCALSVKDKRTGEERLSELLRRVQEDEALSVPPLFREFARIFDVITFPSDDHVGEYFAYGSELHVGKWPYGQESRKVVAGGPLPDEIGGVIRGEVPVEQLLRPSGEVAVRVICALQQAEPVRISAVNVHNTGHLISNLPENAVVEVPAIVDRTGVKPIAVGPIPEPFASCLNTQAAVVNAVTEAYRTRSRKALLQALLLDPCVHSIRAARAILDDMLDLQEAYLPRFE